MGDTVSSPEDDLQFVELLWSMDDRTLVRIARLQAIRNRAEFMQAYKAVKSTNSVPKSTLKLNPVPNKPIKGKDKNDSNV